VILVDASRGVPKAGVCTEPLARDYATLPFGLLKRAIWPQMNDQPPCYMSAPFTFPWRAMQLIEESASLWKRLHCCPAV